MLEAVIRTRSRELFLMTTLGLCFAIALLTSAADLLSVEPKKCRQTVVIPNPLYYWYMVTEQSHCRSLQEKFDEMISMLGKLGAKVEVLQQLVKDYEIGVDFGGVVVMKNGDAPELCLSKETIALLASLNAQFGITLYKP